MAAAGTMDTEPTFVFQVERAKARARPGPKKSLLVLAGSTALRKNNNVRTNRDKDERDQLLRAGILSVHPSDADLYVFISDHLFSSASSAAGVIKNGNVSGPGLWIDTKTGSHCAIIGQVRRRGLNSYLV